MAASLVTVGDSLTQGFKSGAIHETHLSWPTFLAEALGATRFLVPDFSGAEGLPLNLESMLRLLEKRIGKNLDFFDYPLAALTINSFLDKTEDYWERGEGTGVQTNGHLYHHNVAVWGFEYGDCNMLSEGFCRRSLKTPKDDLHMSQIPEMAMYRTAMRTLNPSLSATFEDFSQLEVVEHIARTEGGIENLVICLGANHCLGTCTSLDIRLSQSADLLKPAHLRNCNLWDPSHFAGLLDRVYGEWKDMLARLPAGKKIKNVFVGTVPHVTIAPVCRGISAGRPERKPVKGSPRMYYEYYTHFWVWDDDFKKDPKSYPRLIREEAAFVDRCIDEYNISIRAHAKASGWHVIDLCQFLDDLAYRSSDGKPAYKFPRGLAAALKANPATAGRVDGKNVYIDTRYFRVNPKAAAAEEKYEGGIFSLDGVHPTTVGYAISADFVRKAFVKAGVKVKEINWKRAVASDTLFNAPPELLEDLRGLFTFLTRKTPVAGLIRILGSAFGPNG